MSLCVGFVYFENLVNCFVNTADLLLAMHRPKANRTGKEQ